MERWIGGVSEQAIQKEETMLQCIFLLSDSGEVMLEKQLTGNRVDRSICAWFWDQLLYHGDSFKVKNNDGDQVTATARRLVAPLRCLKNPHFVKLLDQAADEYGFRCQDTVTVCCRPADLDRVLAFCSFR